MALLPATMTAIRITVPGGPEVLAVETRAVPRLGPDEVLIAVRYAGVNRHDCNQRRRGHGPAGAVDTPGLEVAGDIVAVGEHVPPARIGEKVCALVNGGGYAQYCLAQADLALPAPASLSEAERAALPEALFTVWFNVIEIGRLARGDWLLVHGGTSGIGSIAIQVARTLGARVVATSGTAAKCALCATLGADEAVNYREQDFVDVVKRVTGGKGVDVILDTVGGLYADENLAALATEGRLVHISSGTEPDFSAPLQAIMQKRAVVTGSLLRPLPGPRKSRIAAQLREHVWPRIGDGIRPIIDSVHPLASAADAHRRMESGAHTGKILLHVAETAGA